MDNGKGNSSVEEREEKNENMADERELNEEMKEEYEKGEENYEGKNRDYKGEAEAAKAEQLNRREKERENGGKIE